MVAVERPPAQAFRLRGFSATSGSNPTLRTHAIGRGVRSDGSASVHPARPRACESPKLESRSFETALRLNISRVTVTRVTPAP